MTTQAKPSPAPSGTPTSGATDPGHGALRQRAERDLGWRLIARCASPADVAAAVRVGREHDLELRVRCGGHSVLGISVRTAG